MPIYEYACRACGHDFEEWVRKEAMSAPCPACGSEDVGRRLSTPQVHSEGRRDLSMRAARKRDQKQATERVWTQRQYELNHDD